ncbi:MAG TPA: hypothetical protein VN758_02840 [Solirubrobacterales bacterium]|nr:hypothetical protein [Solirubrobacterales bacterium]
MGAEQHSALVLMRSPSDERARRFFTEQGFEVGPMVGISFSIAAPLQEMERLFEGSERSAERGGELPLDRLPPEIRKTVLAVATEAPPDFGPGNP